MPALYVTGEESQQQVAMRARRLELPLEHLKVMTETCIETIIETARREKPRVMVIDSIQTIFTEQLQSAPGGVAQVRESAALLVRFAKQSGTAIFWSGMSLKKVRWRGRVCWSTWWIQCCILRANPMADCACCCGR